MTYEEIIKSIENKSTKQNHELIWAYFFVTHINKKKGSDYEVEEGPNNITDVYAISKSEKFNNLKLQLTWAKEQDFNPKVKIKTLEFSTKVILEAVERKIKKYSNQHVTKELEEVVLIVQGHLPEGWQDLVEDKNVLDKIRESMFLGVYYVSPPVYSSLGLSDGFIIPFKEII